MHNYCPPLSPTTRALHFFQCVIIAPLFLFGEFPYNYVHQLNKKNPLKSHLSGFGANKPNPPPKKKKDATKIIIIIICTWDLQKKKHRPFFASLPARQSAENPIDDGQIPPRADPRIPPGSAPRWRLGVWHSKNHEKNLGKEEICRDTWQMIVVYIYICIYIYMQYIK